MTHDVCELCELYASFNFPGEKKSRYCHSHKHDEMVNTKPKCIIPLCDNLGYKEYSKRCFPCFAEQFPHDPIIKKYKSKEGTTVATIIERFPEKTKSWKLDTLIPDGCSLKRPDMYLDMGQYSIIVEIDENQHRGYSEACEKARTTQLLNDAGKVEKISSCWGFTDKKARATIVHGKINEWKYRMDVLCQTIQDWINKHTSDWDGKLITEVKLFFDEV
jgi:hypothetical protein